VSLREHGYTNAGFILTGDIVNERAEWLITSIDSTQDPYENDISVAKVNLPKKIRTELGKGLTEIHVRSD